MNDTALYIGADPLINNDVDLIRKSINMFGFINIILDRKNRDAEYAHYNLNFDDRSDIIRHELKNLKISSYRIIPIDETVQLTLKQNNIRNLILNFDYQLNTNYRMMHIFKAVNPDVNILLMDGNDFIEKNFLKTLIDSDSTMKMYKKYCSDYTFYKLKLKQTRKICITTKSGYDTDFVVDIFRSRSYNVIDLDSMKLKSEAEVMSIIGKYLIGNFNNALILRMTNIPSDGSLCKIFDDIIYVGDSCDRSVHSDIIFTGNKTEITNQIIHFINRKTQ